ncbi:hypothetical protein FEM48_Zijuj03G0179700 [Ziziphus jujuba var. spinosa]|uniref:Uncharacterized protein n=1 Tax=Ziziphus jujuba var. spinosa TaxID=714518 RepID=A0A978VRS9_ZIZJJ|nr:hypothetical protein FEM48_Zijuj03G0179700 [Ziziphus jujuba var. spinosa]
MASAEAKPAWQRSAANHFSCSTSSSSSSRLESDNTPDNDVKGPHDKCAGFLPFNPNYDVLSDRKWWLNLQPNPGQYKDIMSEQLSTLEAEVLEVLSYEFISKTANSCEDQSKEEFSAKAGNSFEESLWDVIATSMKNDQDTVLQELKAETHNDPQKNSTKKDATDFWYSADHYMNMDSLNCLASQQPRKLSSDMGSQWLGTEKTEPWWRTAGKDDLASLVAQKSLEHIENCDLPRPQGKNYRNSTFAGPESVDQDEILASSLDRMAQTQFSNHDFCTQRSHFSSSPAHDSGLPFSYAIRGESIDLWIGQDCCGTTILFVECLIAFNIDNVVLLANYSTIEKFGLHIVKYSKLVISSSSGYSTTRTDEAGTQNIFDDDQTKAQLMEALCHSQTRAREAEKAAKQAYTEKEHIITLFFRQASQLFAYKQWLRLLQLENLCLQLKNKNELFPSVLPWVPSKGRQMKKGQHRSGKRKHGKPGHELRKSVVAFALGLGLAGAGLLLGWTMGWLFPSG